MLPRSWRRLADSKSNSSTRLPRTTTTRVSSGWVASMSILLAIDKSLFGGPACARSQSKRRMRTAPDGARRWGGRVGPLRHGARRRTRCTPRNGGIVPWRSCRRRTCHTIRNEDGSAARCRIWFAHSPAGTSPALSPVIRPEDIGSATPRARLAQDSHVTAGKLRVGCGACRGGRAGCPNTATPEHIPSARPY